jgi:hypothetical protein
VLLVVASLFIAFLLTRYAASFTGAPLGNGRMEGIPNTVAVIFVVFPLSLIVVLVIGNLLINRYFERIVQSSPLPTETPTRFRRQARDIVKWLGLAPDAAGLVTWDVFAVVLTPGKLILLLS